MKNMIRDVLLLAPLLLRKFTPLPGGYTGKHFLSDRLIFCHDCFLAKVFCRPIFDKRQFTGGVLWNNGKGNEEILLSSAYLNSLKLAIDNQIRSISFPNISTGIYKFPKEKAAKIAIQTVSDFLSNTDKIQKIIFVCFDEENYKIYSQLLKSQSLE
jgi:hypothetical protein